MKGLRKASKSKCQKHWFLGPQGWVLRGWGVRLHLVWIVGMKLFFEFELLWIHFMFILLQHLQTQFPTFKEWDQERPKPSEEAQKAGPYSEQLQTQKHSNLSWGHGTDHRHPGSALRLLRWLVFCTERRQRKCHAGLGDRVSRGLSVQRLSVQGLAVFGISTNILSLTLRKILKIEYWNYPFVHEPSILFQFLNSITETEY